MRRLSTLTRPRLGGLRWEGRVHALRGPIVSIRAPAVAVGDACHVECGGGRWVCAEVVGFQDDETYLIPMDDPVGIAAGARVVRREGGFTIDVSNALLGAIVDVFGRPLAEEAQNRGDLPVRTSTASDVRRPPADVLTRAKLQEPLHTGIRSVDAFCPLAIGQRVGLFASAGVGKSTLLGMLARNTAVDVVVVALVGERRREVRELVEDVLGARRGRTVTVVATSDEAPARRGLAAETATRIAEHFRDQGARVLLLIDSLTRTARAWREVALAAGELPTRQGYPASVFSRLPRLLERAGTSATGSITAIYSVLTTPGIEADILEDEIKSLLDGHLVLDPGLVARGVRPAIHPTRSLSRLESVVLSDEAARLGAVFRRLFDRLERDKELVLLGGAPDPELADALKHESCLLDYLRQSPNELISPCNQLSALRMALSER